MVRIAVPSRHAGETYRAGYPDEASQGAHLVWMVARMSALGWDLPPGVSDADPDAPWNQRELSCWDCGHVDADCACWPADLEDEEQ